MSELQDTMLGDVFGGTGVKQARKAARDAVNLPPEAQELMNMLLSVLRGRVSGGEVTPFVGMPEAPQLGITPLEQELTGLGTSLTRSVGVRPIEEAFASASRTAARPMDLGSIAGEVSPMLTPAIQNVIERERGGRLQLGEELTSQGSAIGSPLIEGQRRLAEQSNRDIAQMVASSVMGERALRGEESGRAGELMLRTGAATPILAEHFASLPRDVATQQFGLERTAGLDRSAMIEQILNLLGRGVGAGMQQFGITSPAHLGGAELMANARQQRINNLLSLASLGMGMGGGMGGGGGMSAGARSFAI